MQIKNFDRIWDCGSLKFELEIKNGDQWPPFSLIYLFYHTSSNEAPVGVM
jgi:hypothetical protein